MVCGDGVQDFFAFIVLFGEIRSDERVRAFDLVVMPHRAETSSECWSTFCVKLVR